jgi:hypothetical protein
LIYSTDVYIKRGSSSGQMAFQAIDAELQKCKAELQAYLAAEPDALKTREFKLDGRDSVFSMGADGIVWITIAGLTPGRYCYSHVIMNPGCSTNVPWQYVLDDGAFVRDYGTYGIRRDTPPRSTFIRAHSLEFTPTTVEFTIETNEFVVTGGGGYTMERKNRRVQFTSR